MPLRRQRRAALSRSRVQRICQRGLNVNLTGRRQDGLAGRNGGAHEWNGAARFGTRFVRIFARRMAAAAKGGRVSEAYLTLAGDVNSDMVRRVFDVVGALTSEKIAFAHVLMQSNGGYVSDGICLYNFLQHAPVEFAFYNAGAIASIAVIVYLAGNQRYASETARFMIHKSHASPGMGARPEELRIIAEGLEADDQRTERILRQQVSLSTMQWAVHQSADLHLTAQEAVVSGLAHGLRDFAPPKGAWVRTV